jgi:tryptophan 2,3-dioxygenase
MYREKYYPMIEKPEMLDYGVYLKCDKLLDCQTDLDDLCNGEELQFQIVHQVEELWMKLMGYTLVDILEYMKQGKTNRSLTLFNRCHQIMHLMINQLSLLETMSPKDYQTVRLQLGNGSGQESPGFRTLLKMPGDLWSVFKKTYLDENGLTIKAIYDNEYDHSDAYMIAEALIEFDELFQKFRWHHLFLIKRSIGIASKSLKGRSVDLLQNGARQSFFPELWQVRSDMTDRWGGSYGTVRDAIHDKQSA